MNKQLYINIYKPSNPIITMIKIKCIICGKEIPHPRVDQLCCNDKKCREEFVMNQEEVFQSEGGGK